MNNLSLVAIGLLLALSSGSVTAEDQKASLLSITDKHIIPAYQKLELTTAELQKQTEKYCHAPSRTSYKALKNTYAHAFIAWQGTQHLRFGPATEVLREFRFQFWPDKRGVVRKHLALFQTSEIQEKLKPENFSKNSVAIQGFSALERLVFRDIELKEIQQNCPLITAISANLKKMSHELVSEWATGPEAHRQFFATANRGNDHYENEQAVFAMLLGSLHTQLEFITDQKLARPMGSDISKAYSKRAEAWRSQLSLAAINKNLIATHALYQIAFSPQLKGTALDERIQSSYEKTSHDIAKIHTPLSTGVTKAQYREQFEKLHQEIAVLKTLIGTELSAKLQLPLGFNSLDGD